MRILSLVLFTILLLVATTAYGQVGGGGNNPVHGTSGDYYSSASMGVTEVSAGDVTKVNLTATWWVDNRLEWLAVHVRTYQMVDHTVVVEGPNGPVSVTETIKFPMNWGNNTNPLNGGSGGQGWTDVFIEEVAIPAPTVTVRVEFTFDGWVGDNFTGFRGVNYEFELKASDLGGGLQDPDIVTFEST
ncbi:MAG: hypothetical protein CL489_06345 [Acidobacteria bacterium]|nr:hypothetical protein [Acidobacteriota bacterium]|tara:strand:- start:47413 stop:47973 length:561 start_codon:yes stop_codon:yes gene_type:complete